MEQAHETADIPRAGDISPFLGFPCPREQAANQLVRHVEYSVSEAGFEINDGCHQDRASPMRGIAADLMRVRYATFSDKLLKAVVMNRAAASAGRPMSRTVRNRSSSTRRLSAFGDARGVPQPSEWRRLDRRIDGEQSVEFGELHSGDAREQGIRGALASAGTAGNGSSLDNRRRRKNDLLGMEGSDNPGSNRLTPVGTPGGLRRGLDHEGQIGGTRRPQPKRRGEDARVVRHRLRPVGILGERGGGDIQPRRQPGHKGVDRLTPSAPGHAGMAKQGELHREAQTIGRAAPAPTSSWSDRVKV